MARYSRNAAILAKLEAGYGTDAAPTGTANALLVSDLSITPLNASNVPRNIIRSYFGASEQLIGSNYVQCQFTLELQSSGTAGTAPAWGDVLQACGMTASTSSAARVEYTPVSASFPSATIYYYDDGLLHKLLGARGTFNLSAKVGERPTLQMQMMGLYGGVAATSNPATTLTAWKTPLVVSDTNTADMVIGGTYTTGTIGAGTTYTSGGLEVALGASSNFIPLVGGESVDITNREATGKLMLDLTAAQEATFSTSVQANTLQAVGLTHGTAAGSTVVVYAPSCQFINWSKQDVSGRRLIGFDLRMIPSSAGNDEIRIVAR